MYIHYTLPSKLPEYTIFVERRINYVKLTAIVFSLIPPTGRTFPVRETSPVIAMSCHTGMSFARDKSAVTIVQPALGPSLGVAPYKTSIKITNTH